MKNNLILVSMSATIKFGRMIKEQREVKSISQEKLAKKLGLSRISINNYEQGKQAPNLDTAIRIAIYLEISLDQLVKLVNESSLNQAISNLENKELSNKLKDALRNK